MPAFQKRQIIGLLIFASSLIALLGVSLSTVEMQPAEIYTPPVTNRPLLGMGSTPGEIGWFFLLVRGFLVVFIISLPIYILLNLLSKDGRKKLLKDILRLIPTLLVLMWLFNRGMPFKNRREPTGEQAGAASLPDFSGDAATASIFEATPKPWMLLVIIICVAALLAGFTFLVLKLLSYRKSSDELKFEKLADNAQSALDDLVGDKFAFQDVVIRCYVEMSQTLQAEDGIRRGQAMTTYEFGQELLAKGFPAQPVEQLTELFEQVRYGHQQPGETEKRIAIESLGAIIEFCKGWHE
jgi:hypothetical protein